MTDEERIADLEAQIAALTAQVAQATSSPPTAPASDAEIRDAVLADRQRRRDIMALPEAAGREGLAEHLFQAGMDVDVARQALAAAPATAPDQQVMTDAQLHEDRRLNGAGLNARSTAGTRSQAAASQTAVDRMRAHLRSQGITPVGDK